ncbi:hypothetical protein [Oceanobacillus sojae]|uniref:hypothetical protein n=1 Tax=Oceanobacillus sojae TaxID=582851 RepID=UPI00364247C6
MSDYKKLNNYVERLQICEESKYDELFTDFYSELESIWSSRRVIASLAYQYRLGEDDAQSIANLTLLDVIKTYDTSKGHFYLYLSSSIANACKKRAKENIKHANANVSSFETSMEDDPKMIPHIPHGDAEEEAIEFLQKESEQHRLLAYLRGKTDEKCRQALSAFLKSETCTYNGAAKLLGIDNETAKRRIRKVAKQFDSSIHGSLYDYLTVHTYPA